MRKPADPVVTIMWCVVGIIALMGIAVALGTMIWASG